MTITEHNGMLAMDSCDFTIDGKDYRIIETHTNEFNVTQLTVKIIETGKYFKIEHQHLCRKILNLAI